MPTCWHCGTLVPVPAGTPPGSRIQCACLAILYAPKENPAMPTDTPLDAGLDDDFAGGLDDMTVSINGGPEVAVAELEHAVADALGTELPRLGTELPGMPPKPRIVRAGRDIDHVKLTIKATDTYKASHPRIVALANALRMDTHVQLACSGIVTGENVTQKVTKDGDTEYVLTITIDLDPTLPELEQAADIEPIA